MACSVTLYAREASKRHDVSAVVMLRILSLKSHQSEIHTAAWLRQVQTGDSH
jgi:hypothetical protein